MDAATMRSSSAVSTSSGSSLRLYPRTYRLVAHASSRERNTTPRRLPSIPADDPAGTPSPKEQPKVVLPRTGYLSLADPKAEVYSRATERFDPEKKLSRWKPEFIWNTNWQETLARQDSLERQAAAAEAAKANAPPASGDLGLSRIADLNNMDMDLSDAFAAASQRHREEQERKAQAAERRAAAAAERAAAGDIGMTRSETRKLTRVTARIARSTPSNRLVSSEVEQAADRAAAVEAELAAYNRLKADFQIWTLSLTAITAAATYAQYGSEDVTISYLVGAAGGFVYLRLLGRSVDAVGAGEGNVATRIAGFTAQPRLLIPVGLALVFNRWNHIYAVPTGITLQLLPILAGFFTYKLALLARQFKDVLQDMSIKPRDQVDAR